MLIFFILSIKCLGVNMVKHPNDYSLKERNDNDFESYLNPLPNFKINNNPRFKRVLDTDLLKNSFTENDSREPKKDEKYHQENSKEVKYHSKRSNSKFADIKSQYRSKNSIPKRAVETLKGIPQKIPENRLKKASNLKRALIDQQQDMMDPAASTKLQTSLLAEVLKNSPYLSMIQLILIFIPIASLSSVLLVVVNGYCVPEPDNHKYSPLTPDDVSELNTVSDHTTDTHVSVITPLVAQKRDSEDSDYFDELWRNLGSNEVGDKPVAKRMKLERWSHNECTCGLSGKILRRKNKLQSKQWRKCTVSPATISSKTSSRKTSSNASPGKTIIRKSRPSNRTRLLPKVHKTHIKVKSECTFDSHKNYDRHIKLFKRDIKLKCLEENIKPSAKKLDSEAFNPCTSYELV